MLKNKPGHHILPFCPIPDPHSFMKMCYRDGDTEHGLRDYKLQALLGNTREHLHRQAKLGAKMAQAGLAPYSPISWVAVGTARHCAVQSGAKYSLLGLERTAGTEAVRRLSDSSRQSGGLDTYPQSAEQLCPAPPSPGVLAGNWSGFRMRHASGRQTLGQSKGVRRLNACVLRSLCGAQGVTAAPSTALNAAQGIWIQSSEIHLQLDTGRQ